MGCNYYLRHRCPTCRHTRQPLHIGKRSAGWRFLFHGYGPRENRGRIDSWAHWRALLAEAGANVVKETGEVLSPQEFARLVEETRGERQHDPAHTDGEDLDGWAFMYREFS